MIPIITGRGRDERALTELQIQVLIEIEPLLREARLHLCCPKCLAAGHGAAALVSGGNGVDDAKWSLDCQCTSRVFHRGTGH